MIDRFSSRIGKTFSPVSGNEVKKDSVTDVINYIAGLENDIRLLITAPFPSLEKYGVEKTLKLLKEQGR